jgi:hypothetical protein
MRHSFAVFALLVLPAVHAAERKEVYAQQLNCATQMLMNTAVRGEDNAQRAAAAANACVTREEMASIYRGVTLYEMRNAVTVRMEMDARKKMVIDGVLYRYQTCLRHGPLKGRAVHACSDFLHQTSAQQ